MNGQEHPPHEALLAYAEARLAASALESVDRHLRDCEPCRRIAIERASVRPVGVLVALRAAADEHLSYDELVSAIAGSLDDQAHLAACESCRAEVADLRAFEAMSAGRPLPGRTPAERAGRSWLGSGLRLQDRRLQVRWNHLGWAGALSVGLAVLAGLAIPQYGSRSGRSDESLRSGSGIEFLRAEAPHDGLKARLSPDRVRRMAAVVRLSPDVAIPVEVSMETLSVEDQALWRWAVSALKDRHLIRGVLAQDLGLLTEAEEAFVAAVVDRDDAQRAEVLLERLEKIRGERLAAGDR